MLHEKTKTFVINGKKIQVPNKIAMGYQKLMNMPLCDLDVRNYLYLAKEGMSESAILRSFSKSELSAMVERGVRQEVSLLLPDAEDKFWAEIPD